MNELVIQFGKLTFSLQALEENVRAYIFLFHKTLKNPSFTPSDLEKELPFRKFTDSSLGDTIAYLKKKNILPQEDIATLSKIDENQKEVAFVLFTAFQGTSAEIKEIEEKTRRLQEEVDRFNAPLAHFLKAYGEEMKEWLSELRSANE